jgi:hypothetical protein
MQLATKGQNVLEAALEQFREIAADLGADVPGEKDR